ncbi:hypothetical protein [Streptococcus hyovaginalis]|uniref:hypothetical protein n=1 Tax=Streptococcus hyovaginalis TaxID=149015 RepID=UPI003B3B5F71
MKILAIDPASNKYETSTTGIVLLDNGELVDHWVASYGMKGFNQWYSTIGVEIECDVVVVEKFEVRDRDGAKDNSVLQTIAFIEMCYPDCILQRNAGYKSDVPDQLLKLLGLWKFSKSHHQDVRAAARLGLFWAMREDVEEVIANIGRIATSKMAS